ncbi:MAG: hypothetical protein PHQ09_00535 [Actinomycetota bacterium]|nr:hypothetical protein [Actinomycetota bacterium]
MGKNLLSIRKNVNKNKDPGINYKDPENIKFAHTSEREFSKILNFYKIRWEYEPRTFILELDIKGNPEASFTPDFYLPDLDLYIELTTLNQSLVTKKNYKIRKLKELYPDINIKLFYKKDYNSLLFKYINR